jgi:hypothetical protein
LKRSANLPLSGFRHGWRANTATNDVNSDSEDRAPVDRIDYAADDSEDDTQEAISMSSANPTQNTKLLKVRSTEFYSI